MTHPADLAAAAASKSPIGSLGACPLRQTHVQLLPLRYGLVEKPLDPSAELKLPYALTTRPLGIRLLRDGWLYVIDSVTGQLHEYQVLNGLVSALLHKGAKVDDDQRTPIEERPALVFSRRSTLHVSFAEVQWTAAKCAQVLDSRDEREHFMQAVDLGPVHCQTGGEHLLTVEQGKQWLAEIATVPVQQAHATQDRAEQEAESPPDAVLLPTVHVSDAPAHEREPYLWEQPRRFREAHIGEFLGRVRPAYQDDTLFLVVQDDLGVLRDLADYQDTVVGWVDDWSNADHNERDYLLACYIESLSQLSPADIGNLADASNDPRVQALFGDLEQLPEPDREHTRKALLDYLNKGGTFTVASPAEHAALQTNLKELLRERDYLKTLTRERSQLTHNKNRQGHKTPRAMELQGEIVRVRAELTLLEGRLAGALSPIAELPDQSARLYGATPARAGVTVVFPPAQQLEVRSLLKDIRLGVGSVPNGKLIRSEGMGLLVFLVQGVNLVSVIRELTNQSKNKRVWMPFFNATMATGAAGFTVAQSLADTALKARSAALVAGLQHHALQNVHVQMGKMHVGLGIFTYGFGFISSMVSLINHHQNWQQAIRSGNAAAQNSAALATAGATGMTTVSAYGLSHTGRAAFNVLVAKNSAARTAAWAAAGTRLSTVFFCFNLAGALFTVLELGGTWLYNRYNISAHDKWLKTTPWSLDTDERGDHTLDEYQSYLAYLLHAPYVQLGPNKHDWWLKDLLLKAKPKDIHLVLPGLKLSDFQPPLSGQPAHRLGIGAQRLSVPFHSRGVPRERKDVISEEVANSLRIVQTGPDRLVLCLQYPVDPDAEFTPASETLELAVCIQTLNAKGAWVSRIRVIRLNLRSDGRFPALTPQSVTEHPPLLLVETHLLELADHAQQP